MQYVSHKARSAQLERLYAMEKSGTHALRGEWRACAGSALRGVVLTWHAHTLCMRRGARVERVYTFKEHVIDACAAHMNDEPALCVVLDRRLYVHIPGLGDACTLPLTFCPRRLFPMHRGVMIVRDQDAHDGGSAAGPHAYYVHSVFDTPTRWTHVDGIDGGIVGGRVAPAFPARGEHVVHVDVRHRLIVTASAGSVRVYTYVVSSEPVHAASAACEPAHHDDGAARPAKVVAAHARRHSARRARRSSRRVSEPMLRHVSDRGSTSFSILDDGGVGVGSGAGAAAAGTGSGSGSGIGGGDAAMARHPSGTTPFMPVDADAGAQRSDVHPLFADFARAHAYVALLDEMAVPAMRAPQGVRAFAMDALLYMVVPCAARVFCRQVVPGPRVVPPVHTCADAVTAARDACLVSVVRAGDAMAVLREDGLVEIVCGPPGVAAARPLTGGVSAIRCGDDLEVCVRGVWTPWRVHRRPADALAARVLEALGRCLPTPVASAVLCRYLDAAHPTWQGLEWTLHLAHEASESDAHDVLAALGLAACEPAAPPHGAAPAAEAPRASSWDAHVAMVLHMLAQDAMLDLRRRRTDAPKLARLLCRILVRLAWPQWLDAWTRLFPHAAAAAAAGAGAGPGAAVADARDAGRGPRAPPSLMDMLCAAWRGEPPSLDAYVRDLAACVSQEPLEHVASVCPTAAAVVGAYAALARAESAETVVAAMLAHGVPTERLAVSVALPLEEAVRTCQLDPPAHASAETYALLQREDAKAAAYGAPPATVPPGMLATLAPGLDPLSAHIFHTDYRLQDVARMLDTTHPHTARVPADASDVDVGSLARALAERTMAQCVGRGLFRYASRPLRTTGTWRTPRLCLSLRTLPDGVLLSDTHEAHELDWPEFHNGVASALEIGTASVDSSWIFAHASASRGGRARHAGFLLGLGLHGHLRRLGRVHAYRYLAPRHTLTTIGLVLGLAASFLGTGDAAARQVMAVQVAAFLPPGSVPLHMSTITQATGLLGMGLVFCGTDHAWTATRLASQLDARIETADANEAHLDVYAQCAGLGLGLVYLGRARRTPLSSAADHALVSRLCRAVAAPQDDAPPLAAARTAHAACLALALVFLRSGRRDVAAALAPPTPATLASTRPDLLLVRSLARTLVLADATPDDQWLRTTCVWTHAAGLSMPCALAFFQIRAGACLGLGLLYAGTADERVRALLLRELMHEAPSGSSYEARVVRAAWTTLQNLVHLALACVMAGTGDVDVLRVLRAAHGCTHDVSYGTHLATHMALGLLFLGGGRFSVAPSDTALAMLLIACVPSFPATSDDSRAHLQAARHLGILALAPRLVAARDVSSSDVCYLPLSVDACPKARAPCLLPAAARSVATRSKRYWPARADVADVAAPSDAVGLHWLHVQRRTGFLSYADDPHGHRSIFARTARSATPQLGGGVDGASLLRDLSALVRGFDTAPEARGLVQYICRAAPGFGSFATSALLDGLLRDAPRLTRVYLALWTGTYEHAAVDRALFVHDALQLLAWYASAADARVRGARERLLHRDMLDSVLWQLTCQARPATTAPDVARYVRGAGAAPHTHTHTLTHAGACALALMQAPLEADLATLRVRFAAAPPALRAPALRRVLRNELLVQACIHAWTESEPIST